MKPFYIVIILLLSNIVSYYVGYTNNDTKNYEAACLQADFIHYLIDCKEECWNLGSEVEESYYEWFNDLDAGAYNTKHLKSVQELYNYSWCY